MSLKTMTLTQNAVISVTGGTPLVFSDDGVSIQNGVHLMVPADPNYQTRRQATAKYRQPALDAKTGVYGKDKKSISFAVPFVLPGGQVVFNTIRVEREAHPSLTNAETMELNKIGAQLLTESGTEGFWNAGSLS